MLQDRHGINTDGFELQRRFIGLLRNKQFLLQFLNSHSGCNILFFECHVSKNLEITGVVVFIFWMDRQNDLLIRFCLSHWLFDSLTVEMMKSSPDFLRNSRCVSDAAKIVTQIQSQLAFFQNGGTPQNTPALEQCRSFGGITSNGGGQHRSFGFGVSVSFENTAAWHKRLLRQIDFHQPSPREAGCFCTIRNSDLDIDLLTFAQQGRQFGPNEDECRIRTLQDGIRIG